MQLKLTITGVLEEALKAHMALTGLDGITILRLGLSKFLMNNDKKGLKGNEDTQAIPPSPAPIQLCSSMRCNDRTLYNGVVKLHTHKPTCPPLSV